MKILKDLLVATIKYQDRMDDLLTDVHVGYLFEEMLDLADKAKEQYPAIMAQFDFSFKKDRQQEFNNLQEFITFAMKEYQD